MRSRSASGRSIQFVEDEARVGGVRAPARSCRKLRCQKARAPAPGATHRVVRQLQDPAALATAVAAETKQLHHLGGTRVRCLCLSVAGPRPAGRLSMALRRRNVIGQRQMRLPLLRFAPACGGMIHQHFGAWPSPRGRAAGQEVAQRRHLSPLNQVGLVHQHRGFHQPGPIAQLAPAPPVSGPGTSQRTHLQAPQHRPRRRRSSAVIVTDSGCMNLSLAQPVRRAAPRPEGILNRLPSDRPRLLARRFSLGFPEQKSFAGPVRNDAQLRIYSGEPGIPPAAGRGFAK